MVKRNGNYSGSKFNENRTDTSVDDAKVAIASDTEGFWSEIGVHLPQVNDEVPRATTLPRTPVTSSNKAPEPWHWSPTQQEVDAYVISLECEVSQDGLRMRQRRAEPHREPSSGSFLCVAAAIACALWLLWLFD
jgi:hypothetical protein